MSKSQINFSRRGNALVGQKMFDILDQAHAIEKQGRKVIHLELGDPSSYPPGRIINNTVSALLETDVGYTSSGGYPAFRESLAAHLATHYHRPVTAAHVAISPANLLITQVLDILCDPGDPVALFLPAFPTYLASAAYVQCPVQAVPLRGGDKFKPSLRDIDRLFAGNPKLIILNSGNNPTGAVYPRKTIERICQKASECNAWILSDETYGLLAYRKPFHSPLEFKTDRTIVVSSFSKIFSIPGYRVGFVLAEPDLIDKIVLSNSTLYSCLPPFVQRGAMAGIGIIDEFTAFMRKRYKRMMGKCLALLKAAPSLSFTVPESAFYVFVDVSETGLDGDRFAERLLHRKGVAVTPGSSFGMEAYIRLSFCGKEEDVLEGIRKIVEFAHERTGKKQ